MSDHAKLDMVATVSADFAKEIIACGKDWPFIYEGCTGFPVKSVSIRYDINTDTYTIKPHVSTPSTPTGEIRYKQMAAIVNSSGRSFRRKDICTPHIKKEKTMIAWEMFEVVKGKCSRMFLSGPHGIGKTHAARQMQNGKGFAQITLNEDLTVQELLGHFLPQGDKFEWHNGPITQVFIDGGLLLINELDKASGAVLDCMLGVLDDPAVAELTLPSGTSYRPGEGLQIVATSNRKIDALPVELADRFEVDINIAEPHPELVEALNDMRNNLGDYIRDSYKDPERAISPRKALAFIKFLPTVDSEDVAGQLAFGSRWFDISTSMKLSVNVEDKEDE